jgi:hypothetical protein
MGPAHNRNFEYSTEAKRLHAIMIMHKSLMTADTISISHLLDGKIAVNTELSLGKGNK